MEEGDERQQVSRDNRYRHFMVARTSLGFVVLIPAIIAVVFWARLPPDPVYNGKRLSAWLYDGSQGALLFANTSQRMAVQQQAQQNSDKARVAIAALGPEAVPLLTDWLQSDSKLREQLQRRAFSNPSSRWLLYVPWVRLDKRGLATMGALACAKDCAPLLPILREQALGQSPNTAWNASVLFAHILDALPKQESAKYILANQNFLEELLAESLTDIRAPLVLGLLRNFPKEQNEEMLRRIFLLRAHIRLAEFAFSKLNPDGTLVNRLYLESGTEGEKASAVIFYRDKPCDEQRVVPLLVKNLIGTAPADLVAAVCDALAAYGTNAAPALPQLTNLLTHGNAMVRAASSGAIPQIAGY